jgi:hypothetical protein
MEICHRSTTFVKSDHHVSLQNRESEGVEMALSAMNSAVGKQPPPSSLPTTATLVCCFLARWHAPACVAKLKQVLSCLENSSASLKHLAAGVYLSFSLLRRC